MRLEPPKTEGRNKDIREVSRISEYIFKVQEAKDALARQLSGRTCWMGMERTEPTWKLVARPTSTEHASGFDYLIESAKPGKTGRRVKAYIPIIPTEDKSIYYFGGIFSTLKAAKDQGPLPFGGFIGFIEHRGGARNVRFDPPDMTRDIWGLEA
jgi:hypothetical protein